MTKGSSPYSFSVRIVMLIEGLNMYNKDEEIFEKCNFKIKIQFQINFPSLYNTVSSPAGATRDTLAERLQSVGETSSLLYNRIMDNIKYGGEKLKDIIEKEVEEQAKEQQQDDDGKYDMVPKIKLVYEGIRMKTFRMTGDLNGFIARMIVTNLTKHTEMRTKVIYSFKSEIYRGAR